MVHKFVISMQNKHFNEFKCRSLNFKFHSLNFISNSQYYLSVLFSKVNFMWSGGCCCKVLCRFFNSVLSAFMGKTRKTIYLLQNFLYLSINPGWETESGTISSWPWAWFHSFSTRRTWRIIEPHWSTVEHTTNAFLLTTRWYWTWTYLWACRKHWQPAEANDAGN